VEDARDTELVKLRDENARLKYQGVQLKRSVRQLLDEKAAAA